MKWTITEQQEGFMIRSFLQREQKFSKRLIKHIVHGGGAIKVNGMLKTVRHVLEAGDVVTVTLPEEKKGAMMVPEKIPLNILYEDDAVLVINKSPGRAVIPSYQHTSGTIANGVLAHYEAQGLPYTFHVVTRLDRNTSGVMLIAKHRWSHSILSNSQKAGQINRSYYAIIEGHLQQKNGTIDAPIGRKEGSIIERTVTASGKHALTHYNVITEYANYTLVQVKLETGRTHQIRVHFSHIGHPLAGDDLYGGETGHFSRQALHCHQLAFEHPITGEWKEFTAELPDDMKH
ncbi:23S rRNA pseudouridine1911/1915/1917 synthase [Lentibacillus persicus]|uniref:Pseudouridine synthase n=1 Tax=Lentibacillus persicus TaxID=640948 RepID=A0A1I1S7Q1_9BACI|nr:RluA family pseudouridine synthase [Lentibacillus persicus]SFD39010.1 23S rRNA pseudouridine1911/1915/1917 synthase [Lentibacillus persicus]